MPIYLFYLLLFVFAGVLFSAGLRDWENPAVFNRNQTPPHTPLAPFDSAEAALKTPFKQSPYLKSLNGTWRFHWAQRPEEAPADFFRPDFDFSRWHDIAVPGCWQMQGFGHPKFRNVHQPFPAQPPLPPSDYNPVGSYRRTFTVPETWHERRIFLRFEGVKSASYVWVNGVEVGFNQGGMEEFEFDVTDLLQPGENVLAVQVFRYSAETYLECQDMWRLSGIYRDVYLLATPQVHLRDFYVYANLDEKYQDARFFAEIEVAAYQGTVEKHQVRVNLYDPNGQPVFQPILRKLKKNETWPVRIEQPVKNPLKWSAEYPHLYTVTFELLNPEGTVLEALSNRFGFRKTEIIDQAIYVNGAPVKFNGVNSHVQHPRTGRAMDVETMRRDLILMKQFNINCVRTSHYPPNIEYLQLADELGIYVIDEVNDEAHATEYLSEDPAWRPMYLDRVTRMVIRDRNHPCIVFWSAGNESGSGENIAAVIATGKKLDPARPIWMYGGNFLQVWYEDVIGPRYPTHVELEEIGQVAASQDPRPSFMDEYLAATGNSLGMLDEYWDIIYRYPRLTGGAIWDWISPGISQKIRLTPDTSPNQILTHLMGNARLVTGKFGRAIALSGHDEWVEMYRHPALDITDALTLSLWLYPRRWNGHCPLITKGNHQYGLQQFSRDSLEFYIQSGKRVSALAKVPADWAYRWHHVAGIYNGSALKIFIDGQLAGETPHTGRIDYSAFAPAIGKNTELHGQEHDGELCNAVIDRVRIFAKAAAPDALLADAATDAVIQLDFETVTENGEFFSLGIGGRSYGLVWPDRQVQPEMYQLKKTPQPVQVTLDDPALPSVRILNRHNFKNLKELDVTWFFLADADILQSGTLNPDLPPRKSASFNIPLNRPELEPGVEYRLLLRFTLPEATAWAEKGHEVAWEQLDLHFPDQPKGVLKTQPAGKLTLNQNESEIHISGENFEYAFSKTAGIFTTAIFKGKELLLSGPQFNPFRAPTANETERQWGPRMLEDEWRHCGLDRLKHRPEPVTATQKNGAVEISLRSRVAAEGFSAQFHTHSAYLIFPDGEIHLDFAVNCTGEFSEWIPKIGLQMVVPDELDQFQWYGRGPMETYPDRKTGAKIGLFSETAAGQLTPYLIPQDYGNKTDVRWATLTNAAGTGWFVQGGEWLNLSVHEFSTDHLDRAWYPFQLQKDGRLWVNIDHRVSGVGGTPIKTLEKYRVKPGNYRFQIRLKPIDLNGISPTILGREVWQVLR